MIICVSTMHLSLPLLIIYFYVKITPLTSVKQVGIQTCKHSTKFILGNNKFLISPVGPRFLHLMQILGNLIKLAHII